MLSEDSQRAYAYERRSPSPAYDGDDGFDLKRLLKVLRRRKNIILVLTVLITAISALISFSLTPRYTAIASVLLEPRKNQVIDTKGVVVEGPADVSVLVAEVNLLKSWTYAQRVVKDLDLLSDPQFTERLEEDRGPMAALAEHVPGLLSWLPSSLLVATGLADDHAPAEVADAAAPTAVEDPLLAPAEVADAAAPTAVEDPLLAPAEQADAAALAEAEALLALAPDASGASVEEVAVAAAPSAALQAVQAKAANAVLRGLEVGARGDHLIVIEYTSDDPENAARIANKVAQLYVGDQLESKRIATDKALDWLKERVAELRQRVLRSEETVAAYRAENGLSDVPGRGGGGPLQQLATARAERVANEELLRWVRELREQGAGLETYASVLTVPALDNLRQQALELQRQEALLRTKYAEQHPQITQLNSGNHPLNIERGQLAQRTDSAIQAAIRNLEGMVAFARHREKELEQQLKQVSTESTAEGRAEVRLRDLERQAESDRSLYVAFLNRFKEVSEQRDLLEPGAKVAAEAGVPGEPTFPRPKLMTAAGFTIALMLGTMIAFLTEYLDGGLRTTRQVERVLRLHNLGFVPQVSGLGKRQKLHQYLLERPRSAYAEAVRAIQLATTDATDRDRPVQVVLVTSSLPGEGKTTLALSLGAAAAGAGRKTVVMDLDLRRPRLHHELARAPDAGLVEFMAGERTLDEALHAAAANLDVLPVRRLPGSPADLIRAPKMASLLAELRTRYEYIVLDSPPLLGMIDAKLAARLADVAVFTVQWEKTTEEIARTGLEALLDDRIAIAGAVLTRVNLRRHAKQGYGDAVQYHSSYQKYYAN